MPSHATDAPTSGPTWLAEGLAIHDPERLFAMFARSDEIVGSGTADPRAIAVDQCATSAHWASRRADRDPARRLVDVVAPLAGVVRFSRKVWLIDYCIAKHLGDDRVHKFAPTVKKLLQVWSSQNGLPRVEFKILTENPGNSPHQFWTLKVKPLRNEVAPFLPQDGSTVSVAFYNPPHRHFHRNRFLLTDVACVQVGKGFDPPADPAVGRDVLTLLSDKTARDVENDFDLYGQPVEISLR